MRAFSRTSWESGDDVDLDSVAYGFMASQAQFSAVARRLRADSSQALFSALELGIFDKVWPWPTEADCHVMLFHCSMPHMQVFSATRASDTVRAKGRGGICPESDHVSACFICHSPTVSGSEAP